MEVSSSNARLSTDNLVFWRFLCVGMWSLDSLKSRFNRGATASRFSSLRRRQRLAVFLRHGQKIQNLSKATADLLTSYFAVLEQYSNELSFPLDRFCKHGALAAEFFRRDDLGSKRITT